MVHVDLKKETIRLLKKEAKKVGDRLETYDQVITRKLKI